MNAATRRCCSAQRGAEKVGLHPQTAGQTTPRPAWTPELPRDEQGTPRPPWTLCWARTEFLSTASLLCCRTSTLGVWSTTRLPRTAAETKARPTRTSEPPRRAKGHVQPHATLCGPRSRFTVTSENLSCRQARQGAAKVGLLPQTAAETTRGPTRTSELPCLAVGRSKSR